MEQKPAPNDLPIGFAMALAQNGPAMTAFSAMDQMMRAEIVERARRARSRADMRDIVDSLGQNPIL